jgi:hypothetical protein
MEKTETFLSANNQQLDEITRLLQQRDACNEWTSHSIEREDEKEMRRFERNERCGDFYKQLEKLGTEVVGLRQSGNMLPGPVVGAALFDLAGASAMQLILGYAHVWLQMTL